MANIQKIKAEIERNRQAIRVLNEHTAPEQMSKTCAIFQYADSILSGLNSFINSLPEETNEAASTMAPSSWSEEQGEVELVNDLEEEVKRYYSDNFTYISSDQPTLSILTNVARHFAEWQKERMIKDAKEIITIQRSLTEPEFVKQRVIFLKEG